VITNIRANRKTTKLMGKNYVFSRKKEEDDFSPKGKRSIFATPKILQKILGRLFSPT
jgi:hypothetical protein